MRLSWNIEKKYNLLLVKEKFTYHKVDTLKYTLEQIKINQRPNENDVEKISRYYFIGKIRNQVFYSGFHDFINRNDKNMHNKVFGIHVF